jgi:hypothetical protein
MWTTGTRRGEDRRSRGRHERLSSDADESIPSPPPLDNPYHEEAALPAARIGTDLAANSSDGPENVENADIPENSNRHDHTSSTIVNGDSEEGGVVEEESLSDDAVNALSRIDPETHSRLMELSAAREYHRRKSSSCTFFMGLILFRLWIEAILTSDPALTIISALASLVTLKYIARRSMEEREYDERIATLLREAVTDEEQATIEGSSNRRASSRMNNASRVRGDFSNQDHIDFEMLSFQAQLALALMESQRILQTGGFGRPDGTSEGQRGVSDDAKAQWQKFDFSAETFLKARDGQNVNTLTKSSSEEEPSCCICLCEYEEGESLSRLPCGHAYHSECIESWCSNHFRCPLCNIDLEGGEDGDSPGDSIV